MEKSIEASFKVALAALENSQFRYFASIRVASCGLNTMNTRGCTSVGMPLKSMARYCCLEKAPKELPKLTGNKRPSNQGSRRLVRPSSKISVMDGRFRQSENKIQSLVEQISYKEVCSKEISFQEMNSPRAADGGDHYTSYEEAFSNRSWETRESRVLAIIDVLCGEERERKKFLFLKKKSASW